MKDRLKERREQRRKAEEERVRKESDDRYSIRSDSFSSGGSRPATRDSQAVTKIYFVIFPDMPLKINSIINNSNNCDTVNS